MTSLTARLIVDQFVGPDSAGHKRLLAGEIVSIALAVVSSVLCVRFCLQTNAVGALLTATSIMTGLVFTMAMRFWERSLDARVDPELMFDGERRQTLDRMRSLLIWTVLAGIASTVWFAGLAITIGTGTASVPATAISAGLVTYQLSHVVLALLSLYRASYTLRS